MLTHLLLTTYIYIYMYMYSTRSSCCAHMRIMSVTSATFHLPRSPRPVPLETPFRPVGDPPPSRKHTAGDPSPSSFLVSTLLPLPASETLPLYFPVSFTPSAGTHHTSVLLARAGYPKKHVRQVSGLCNVPLAEVTVEGRGMRTAMSHSLRPPLKDEAPRNMYSCPIRRR